MENKTRKITGIAAGALAITSLSGLNNANAAELVTFTNLGSGAELRSELISSAMSFVENGAVSMNIEAKCGEKSSTTSTKGKEGKCGEKGKEGKCGEKGKEGKCGEKGKEGKCGEKGKEGKCGEKGKEAKCGEKGKEAKCGEKGKEAKCGEKKPK